MLCGTPKEEKVYPISSEIQIQEKFVYDLPAYSFTVIPIESVSK